MAIASSGRAGAQRVDTIVAVASGSSGRAGRRCLLVNDLVNDREFPTIAERAAGFTFVAERAASFTLAKGYSSRSGYS